MKIILHIDMNSYFATLEQQADPRLRGRPIVVSGKPHIRSVVAAASIEAKRYGIKSGMSTWEAKRLYPNVIFVPGDPDKYISATGKLLGIFEQFTPFVELFSIDEAFLDVTQTQHFFGGALKIAKRIKKQIHENLGEWVTCSIGISENKLLAKLASEMKKPDGLTILWRRDFPKIINQIKLTDFCGIGEKIALRLSKIDIKTVADLANAQELVLVCKFGVVGKTIYNMGQGIGSDVVTPHAEEPEEKSFSHSFTLPSDTSNPRIVYSTLLRLAEKVGRRMRKANFSGRTIFVGIRFNDFSFIGRQKKLGIYIDDGFLIYTHATSLLQQFHMGRPIRMIDVGMSDLIHNNFLSESFLPDEQRRKKIVLAMDRVNDMFGEFTVSRALLLQTKNMEKNVAGIRQRLRFF